MQLYVRTRVCTHTHSYYSDLYIHPSQLEVQHGELDQSLLSTLPTGPGIVAGKQTTHSTITDDGVTSDDSTVCFEGFSSGHWGGSSSSCAAAAVATEDTNLYPIQENNVQEEELNWDSDHWEILVQLEVAGPFGIEELIENLCDEDM